MYKSQALEGASRVTLNSAASIQSNKFDFVRLLHGNTITVLMFIFQVFNPHCVLKYAPWAPDALSSKYSEYSVPRTDTSAQSVRAPSKKIEAPVSESLRDRIFESGNGGDSSLAKHLSP
jgi:hypothetical protein